jgi:hypothetical protein
VLSADETCYDQHQIIIFNANGSFGLLAYVAFSAIKFISLKIYTIRKRFERKRGNGTMDYELSELPA